jgi:aminoglycoside phosphotransferase (APT) family kinase protein
MDVEDLHERLERWARDQWGDGVRVAGLKPMPGNAGLSFGFDVVAADGSVLRALVVRFAPPGVRKQGNTDVLRQVPLLHALQDAGIPVAPVVWSTGDESWFGTDALVQERLAARPLSLWEPTGGVTPIDGQTGPYLRRAVAVLADIHALDWRRRLDGWATPRSVEQEVGFWSGLLDKHLEPAWSEAGRRLGAALLDGDPGNHQVGLFHGDYQTNNVLYDEKDGEIAAVVDWEIAGIGPTALDLGWLAMMTDPSCWHEARRPSLRVVAEPAQLVAWYEESAGQAVPHPQWYQALACYRFGAIAGFNVRLHRTGRRVDPLYEELAGSVPVLFERGLELLATT